MAVFIMALISLTICALEVKYFSCWWVNPTIAKEFISIYFSISSGLLAIFIASSVFYLNMLNTIAAQTKDYQDEKLVEVNKMVEIICDKGGKRLTFVGCGSFITIFLSILIHGYLVLLNESIPIILLLFPQMLLIFSLLVLGLSFVGINQDY